MSVPASQVADEEPTVLWYGPFSPRFAPVWLSLAGLLVSLFWWMHIERSAFRLLECERPGECVVKRGSDRFGMHEDRRFDVAALASMKRVRIGKKGSVDALVVELPTGRYEIVRGMNEYAVESRVRAFLDAPQRDALAVHVDAELIDAVLPLWAFVFSVVGVVWFAHDAWRRSGRLRIEVDARQLRAWRTGALQRSRPIVLERADLASLELEGGVAAGRIVLRTRDGRRVPLLPRRLPLPHEHAEVFERLKRELLRRRD